MAERVLISHECKTLDVQDVNGLWYFMSISPYRSPNNKEDGVVIMFMEITQNKLNEEKVLQLNRALNDSTILLSGMLSVLQECVVILDCNMTIHSSNDLFCKKFLLQSDEIIGHSFYEVGNNQWDIPALRTLLNGVLTDDLVVNGYVLEHTFLRAGYKQLILNVRKTTLREGESFIFIAIEER